MESIKLFGEYQGIGNCEVVEIKEVEGGVEIKDSINGDFETDFFEDVDLERVVEVGIEVGLWVKDEDRLVELDFDRWGELYNILLYL